MFLAAYACSGLAGLIYEVTWARLLTLYMGHGTAAVSTVVAAFMGGLFVRLGMAFILTQSALHALWNRARAASEKWAVRAIEHPHPMRYY